MLCREVMKSDPITCRESDTIGWCAQLMRDFNTGFLPVIDRENRLVGVITDRDIVLRAVAEGRPGSADVGTIMTPEPIDCRADDPLRIAERRMANGQKSRIVVTDAERRCVGVISLSDIAQAESRRRAGEVLKEVTRREAGGSEWEI